MNKRKHDWKHFSRRTLSLVLVLVTLVALCIPTGMALEDNSADVETQPAAVQTAETETGADTGAAATSETDAQPVAETEPTAEVGQEPVTEPEAEQVSEPETTAPTPAETQTAQPTGSEPVSEPETTEPEQTTVPTVAASNVQTVGEPETTENITTIDLGSNEAAALLLPDDDNALAVSAALTTIDVTITDDIKASGALKVTVPTDVALGTDVTYKWYKSNSQNGTYTEVTRKKVTGSSYNVTEYGDQVNVVLDGGAQMWYKVEAINADGQVIATSSAYQVNYYKDVQNGGFESPAISSDYGNFYAANGAFGLIWRTTGVDPENRGRDVEMGNNRNSTGLYNAYGITGKLIPEGKQVAELNAEAYGTLYQDVLTTPNATLNWQLYHTARMKEYSNGINEDSLGSLVGFNRNGNSKEYSDVMYVMIMSTVTAEALNITSSSQTQAIVNAVRRGDSTYNGVSLSGVTVAKVEDGGKWAKETTGYGWNQKTTYTCNRYYVDSSGTKHYYKDNPSDTKWKNSEWTRWTGTYAVPAGQYMTRFFFVSYSSAYDTWKGSGNNYNTTIGNLLDDVKFTTDPLPPDPDRGNLTVTKQVTGLDTLPENYSVTVSTTGLEYTFKADEFIRLGDGTWTASHTFSNIPANVSYTLTETASQVDNYEWTADGGNSKDARVEDGKTATVTFTNSYVQSTGTLTINKTITGLGADELAELKNTLTFTATATDNSDSFTFKLTDTGVVDNGNGSYTFTKEGLKAGTTYTVTESGADVNRYDVETTYTNEGKATIKANDRVSVDIANRYTKNVGDLTIVKNIQVNSKWMTDDELDKLKQNITFTATNPVTHEEKTFTGTWNENTFTATITDLPVGTTWTVSEANYELDYHNCTAKFTDNKNSATIKADEVQKVEITNTYTDKLIDLTITKTVSGKHSHDASFTFIATNNRTGVSYTLTIVGNGTDVIKQVPAGNYTVKELDNDNYKHVGDYTFTRDVVKDETFSFENKGTGDSYQYSSSAVNKGAVDKDGKIIFTKPEKINHITKTN